MRVFHRPLLLCVLALAATALIACASSSKTSDRKLATVNGDGFSARVPGTPTRSVRTIQTAAGPIPVTLYTSGENGDSEGFIISVGGIPSGVRFDLDGAMKGSASNVSGTLTDVKTTTYQGFPARDARITGAQDHSGHEGTVFVRVILAKRHFYQLQFIKEGGDVKSPPASYATFLSSLKIG